MSKWERKWNNFKTKAVRRELSVDNSSIMLGEISIFCVSLSLPFVLFHKQNIVTEKRLSERGLKRKEKIISNCLVQQQQIFFLCWGRWNIFSFIICLFYSAFIERKNINSFAYVSAWISLEIKINFLNRDLFLIFSKVLNTNKSLKN